MPSLGRSGHLAESGLRSTLGTVSRRVWTVAAVQLSSGDEIDRNLAAVEHEVAVAAAAGATLVLLPENFAWFGAAGARAGVAERVGDPAAKVQRALGELSRRWGLTLVAGGHPELSGDPARPFNTAFVFAPTGQVVATYRKRHLFDVTLPDGTEYEESATTTAGDEVVVVDVDGLLCGLSICYDLRFPEHFRRLSAAGAEVLLVPAAFTRTTGEVHFEVLLRARAIENQCWVIAANQWGIHPGDRATWGHSCVIDPWGRIVAEAEEGVGSALASVDSERTETIRHQLPALRHRR